jgi:hypothetical protein
MKSLALWTLLAALTTVLIWAFVPIDPARAGESVCLPPTIPPISALQPLAFRTAVFSQQGATGHVHPIRIQQVRYVDQESREYVFSWFPLLPGRSEGTATAQPILLGVDDDPDGPTPAWYDAGAATPTGHVRAEPQQACIWQRFRRGGEVQS